MSFSVPVSIIFGKVNQASKETNRRVRRWVGGRTVGQVAVCVDLWLGR